MIIKTLSCGSAHENKSVRRRVAISCACLQHNNKTSACARLLAHNPLSFWCAVHWHARLVTMASCVCTKFVYEYRKRMKETWSRSGGSCCATLAATASCTQRCMRHQSPVGPSRAQNETMKVMGEMTTINKEQNNHTSPPFAECKNAGVTLCTCSRFDDARHCHADAATLCGMSGGGDTCVADDRARRAYRPYLARAKHA